VLQVTTFTLIGLLLFEDMPWTLLASCLASNVAYYFVLQTFPFIQLTSPVFIASLGISILLTEIVSVMINGVVKAKQDNSYGWLSKV